MRALKVILIVLLLLVALIGGGVYYLFSSLDSIVASAIEKIGTEVTGTEVSVDRVHFKLRKGRGEIHGLHIANPQGYSSDSVFKFDQVALQIEPVSLTEPVIVFNEILIDGAVLTTEHKGGVSTNVEEVMQNIRSQFASDEEARPDPAPGEELRYMVEKLSFTNISLLVISPEFDNRTVTLDDLKRSNLGTRERGLSAQELAQAVVQPLIDNAQKRLTDELKSRARDEAGAALEKNLSDSDKDNLDKVRSFLKDD